MKRSRSLFLSAAFAVASALPALAFTPSKPVEFVVTAGAGGGTDIFARTIQSIIQKHNLMGQSIVVTLKGGGSGAEGFVYGKTGAGDPHRLIFGTSNQWLLPMVAKVGWKREELTPVAALAFDEFLLWTRPDAPWKTAGELVAAAKAGNIKVGGSQSKDLDETLLRIVEQVAGIKTTYIPFKSGGEAAVQLAGGHIDLNTNNPAENVGQWKAGQARPICVFSPTRLAAGPKVTETMAWSDIPTCKEQGLAIEEYKMPAWSTCRRTCPRRLSPSGPMCCARCSRPRSGRNTSPAPRKPAHSSPARSSTASWSRMRRAAAKSSKPKTGS